MNTEEWLHSLGGGHVSDPGSGWVPTGGRLRSARVLVDSAVDQLEAVRAAATDQQRQLVLDAAGRTVVIDLSPLGDDLSPLGGDGVDPSMWRMARGRVEDEGVLVVQVCSLDGIEAALAVSDALGEFEIAIPIGRWLLVLSGDDVDVDVEIDVT